MVPIVLMSDAHSQLPTCFTKLCFWSFENITLELPEYPSYNRFHPCYIYPCLYTMLGVNRQVQIKSPLY